MVNWWAGWGDKELEYDLSEMQGANQVPTWGTPVDSRCYLNIFSLEDTLLNLHVW